MKLKIISILCIMLMLTSIIPVQSQTVDDDISDESKLIIKTRKIGRTSIFIVKVNKLCCNESIYMRISRGLGILGKGYTIDKIPTIKIKFFPIKTSNVYLDVHLINNTGCEIEGKISTIKRGFTSRALIIVKK